MRFILRAMQLRSLSLFLSVATAFASAQSPAHVPIQTQQQVWQMQDSGTTAGLRGIDSVDGTVAWASGTEGTVLRTTDGGSHWTKCAVPDAAKDGATLDFRGVQAWDAMTAIVMASGPGEKSRLYKTVDGCAHWSLLFTNPDTDGFWDAFVANVTEARSDVSCKADSRIILGAIFGDPAVHKSNQWDTTKLPSFYLADFETGFSCPNDKLFPSASSIFAQPAEAAFAASNSNLKQLGPGTFWIATRSRLIQYSVGFTVPSHYVAESFCDIGFPVGSHLASAGAFSLAMRPGSVEPPKAMKIGGFHWKTPSCQKADMVVAGGDYKAVDDRQDTAAFTGGTNKFQVAKVPPHGYRSTVQWSESFKLWVTAGTNGSDISRDDGRTWQPLDNGNWNALSLPFIVGPKGRIGKLDPSAIPKGN
jgi:hypothetical protein